MSIMFYFFYTLLYKIILLQGEMWKKDVSSQMKIGLSTTGYKRVDLKCDTDYFSINMVLENNFEGVVYTRGSFNKKKSPCFYYHNQSSVRKDDQLSISFRIPFNQCLTTMDVTESRYTNTLVIQHDPDLIMPGDAAFRLDCTFTPEYKVSADFNTELPFKSKITLVDADPSSKLQRNTEKNNFTVYSKSENVSFFPDTVQIKDEL